MSRDHRSLPFLASLLPAGALGLSAGLAASDAAASAATPDYREASVAQRLLSLRLDVSAALEQHRKEGEPFVLVDSEQRLAWWGNGGWRNGGWRNGGWGNGAWHNGWHNW